MFRMIIKNLLLLLPSLRLFLLQQLQYVPVFVAGQICVYAPESGMLSCAVMWCVHLRVHVCVEPWPRKPRALFTPEVMICADRGGKQKESFTATLL